jgi:hypothetical protein
VIQRFRCAHCRHTFSTQSFSTTYWLRRPKLLQAFFYRLLAGSGYRQCAREARCAHTTVMGQAARLGRHALLTLHELRPNQGPMEPLVIDGFESFAYSQYHPLHLNHAIGKETHFIYAFSYAELRRKGRMTDKQRDRRRTLEHLHGRPDPKAIEKSIATLLRLAVPVPQSLVLHSDEHDAYPRALLRLSGWSFEHHRTSSKAARIPANPLFSVNLIDLLHRHNCANHKRETIAFSKRGQAVVERAALLILWRNWVKPFSENHDGGTPAMRLGLTDRPWTVPRLLQRRRFYHRIGLPREYRRYYRREIRTAEIPAARYHRLKLAF